MAFPFLCPQRHLLQADESEVGHQMQCPYCGVVFVVPPPVPGSALDPAPPTPPASPESGPQAHDFPGVRTEPRAGQAPGAVAADPAEFRLSTAADLPIVHIVCPNGHSLETPQEMLGQEALCPFCQTQFRLRLEDSAEYREEKAKEKALREIRAGQLWLRWAITAAVVVAFGLIVLMLLY